MQIDGTSSYFHLFVQQLGIDPVFSYFLLECTKCVLLYEARLLDCDVLDVERKDK